MIALAYAVLLNSQAPSTPRPLTVGQTHEIASKVLKERRNVNVVLPPSYASDTTRRYPVLYVIDGGVEQDLLHVAGASQLGAMWGRSAEAIVVGVEAKDRRKELAGPTRDAELLKRYPTAGSSEAFRRFVREEIKPLIARTYRISEHDAVIGESLAGLFILETYLKEPILFDTYAAIDPSLWWDKEALAQGAQRQLQSGTRGRLYLAFSKEASAPQSGVRLFTGSLKGTVNSWCLTHRPDLTHSTIYQQLTPQALQYVLPPQEAPPTEFGFEVKCSEKF